MTEVDKRLAHAIATNADPRVVSPEGRWFAWRPVIGWDHRQQRRRWLWWEQVKWFRPLGLFYEYDTWAGSPAQFKHEHGYYPWNAHDGRSAAV